ncbi:MAG: acriflavin resistance protein [Actinobacteria bacterium]|nr:acriflavin resistance protein [Actinomycetota bacterium]
MAEDHRLGRTLATTTDSLEIPRPARAGRGRLSLAWLGITPFLLYTFLFLFLPAGQVMFGAFQDQAGGYTLTNVETLFEEPYRSAFRNSIEVSLVTAGVGGLLGVLIAYAAIREGTPRIVRTILTTFSGVAANFAGIPLAFAFIATLGTIGILTQFLADLGIDLYGNGFSLFSKTGVELAYLYFQIPLMILVIAPAIDGLRREWREASANLGASPLQFWRYIGLPILTPSLLGATVLLFGNSFSAYATAYGLTAGGVNLVPITIGNFLSGDVLSNPHLGQALALGMFVVLAVMMIIYIPLQRISSRWVR